MIKKTKFYSKKIKSLAKGCQLCVQGKKLVLFVTGLCSNNCYYCPLSDQKKNKDLVWANEWKIKNVKDVVDEAELCEAKGAGITGGDPLLRLDRTVRFVGLLKKKFGKEFHVHLYTPLKLVTLGRLKKLYNAGVDEIRFHPEVDDDKLWGRVGLGRKFNWDVGIEIPVIPGEERNTIKLIDFIKDKVDFLNLNELEISDTNANKLINKGFKTKDRISYAIKGSEEMGGRLLRYCLKTKLKVHYCTAKLKDKVQLANRIKRRAKNIAKPYDVVNEDGTLFRGVIYSKKDLRNLMQKLMKEFDIPSDLIEFDEKKKRILTASWIVDELKYELKKMNLKPALVEEYPTWDQFEVSLEFL